METREQTQTRLRFEQSLRQKGKNIRKHLKLAQATKGAESEKHYKKALELKEKYITQEKNKEEKLVIIR